MQHVLLPIPLKQVYDYIEGRRSQNHVTNCAFSEFDYFRNNKLSFNFYFSLFYNGFVK